MIRAARLSLPRVEETLAGLCNSERVVTIVGFKGFQFRFQIAIDFKA